MGRPGLAKGRGIGGCRHWHQIPFLDRMSDRGRYVGRNTCHVLGGCNHTAVIGWPGMHRMIAHGGWSAIPPVDKKIEMRNLGSWRVGDGLIRENRLVEDLLQMYRQSGVDVIARIRAFNKVRAEFALKQEQHDDIIAQNAVF